MLTVGGAGQTPKPAALAALTHCPDWLLAFDHDAAGDAATCAWRARGPGKCRRAVLPFGSDVGEFVQGGGDLRRWLAREFERFGWNWPGI